MSASVRDQSETRDIELGSGVSWPFVYAAGGLGLVVLTAAVVFGLLYGKRAASGNEPALACEGKLTLVPPKPVPLPPPSEKPLPPVEHLTRLPAGEIVPEAPELLPPPAVVKMASALPPASSKLLLAEARNSVGADAAGEAKLSPFRFKRRFPENEVGLSSDLTAHSREVDLETEAGAGTALVEATKKDGPFHKTAVATSTEKDGSEVKNPPTLTLIAKRADLRGLPVRGLSDCQADTKDAQVMAKVSTELRCFTPARSRRDTDAFYEEESKRSVGLFAYLDKKADLDSGRRNAGQRILLQVLQIESAFVRLKLVKVLAETNGQNASAALAQRAVFDLSAEVREAAVAALKDRPYTEYQGLLLEALRYPWAPAADHAAEALVQLKNPFTVPALVLLLDKPDPQSPTKDMDHKWVANELVRVNHLGNCLLCHAPSTAKGDLIRGAVPVRGEPLPPSSYDSRSGTFVRADVTYLKQDFSVMQPVTEPKQWPSLQRFDYLVRKRELSAVEVKHLESAPAGLGAETPASYPQREAVLWALRELTGENLGSRTQDWCQFLYFPPMWQAP